MPKNKSYQFAGTNEPFTVKSEQKRNKKVLITVKEDLLTSVDTAAKKTGVPRSVLIEQALEYAIDHIVYI